MIWLRTRERKLHNCILFFKCLDVTRNKNTGNRYSPRAASLIFRNRRYREKFSIFHVSETTSQRLSRPDADASLFTSLSRPKDIIRKAGRFTDDSSLREASIPRYWDHRARFSLLWNLAQISLELQKLIKLLAELADLPGEMGKRSGCYIFCFSFGNWRISIIHSRFAMADSYL